MTVKKIINNNVVTAIDEANQEVVLMGKGIGFQAKAGTQIPKEKIEKKFVLSNIDEIGKFEEVVRSIPVEYLDVCVEIINYAMSVLTNRLSSSIYISLTDHINFSVERYKTGFIFDNPLAQEVKNFYPTEYLVGEYAIETVEKKLGIKLPIDEAASVAMHFVNAEYNMGMSDTMHITTMIREMIGWAEDVMKMKIDDVELDHARFIAHIKFLAFRVFKEIELSEQDEAYNDMVSSLYPKSFECAKKIAHSLEKRYNYIMRTNELVNMTIHIRRVSSNIEKE